MCFKSGTEFFFKTKAPYTGRHSRDFCITWRKPQVSILHLVKVIRDQRLLDDF